MAKRQVKDDEEQVAVAVEAEDADDEAIEEVETTGNIRINIYEVTGTTDMLMHNPAVMTSGAEPELAGKKIPTPEEEAKAGRYIDEDGNFYVPAAAIRKSIVEGGKGRRVGRVSAKMILSAGLFAAEERCPLLDAKTGKPMKGTAYKIDTRRVVIPKVGGIMRSRPRISNWMFRVPLEVDALIPDKLILDAGAIAGRIVGVLDFRPARSGPFGRYKIRMISGNGHGGGKE